MAVREQLGCVSRVALTTTRLTVLVPSLRLGMLIDGLCRPEMAVVSVLTPMLVGVVIVAVRMSGRMLARRMSRPVLLGMMFDERAGRQYMCLEVMRRTRVRRCRGRRVRPLRRDSAAMHRRRCRMRPHLVTGYAVPSRRRSLRVMNAAAADMAARDAATVHGRRHTMRASIALRVTRRSQQSRWDRTKAGPRRTQTLFRKTLGQMTQMTRSAQAEHKH